MSASGFAPTVYVEERRVFLASGHKKHFAVFLVKISHGAAEEEV